MTSEKQNNSEFFQNDDCEFFPCHKVQNTEEFNCQFCYCPLYFLDNCGGNFKLTAKGVKDCSDCTIPHLNRNQIINRIKLENELRLKKRHS